MKRIPFPRSLGILPQFSDITAAGRRTEFDVVLGEDLIEKRKFRKKLGFWRNQREHVGFSAKALKWICYWDLLVSMKYQPCVH
ncbi:hypothetical protein MRB53_025066 [Persea americana]|uniref:Uncharacterized protein n=1 Tax=Persea americana TaxID=3435 RepID=A0ACC2LEY2_PERAE|nr:hypothetical protein MRB53_025066 [Persea americana]